MTFPEIVALALLALVIYLWKLDATEDVRAGRRWYRETKGRGAR